MCNISFAHSNLTDASSLSGTGWSMGYPLSNLQERELAIYARSTATNPTIDLDHQSAKSVQFVGLFAHNLGGTTSVTVKRGTTPGGSDVYSGAAEAGWAFAPLDGNLDGAHFGLFFILPTPTVARYTTIEISSSVGNLRIGRLFVGPIFIPSENPDTGDWSDDWMSPNSIVSRTENGADWVYPRTEKRSQSCVFNRLTWAEGSTLHEIIRTHGVTGEIVYLPDIDDRAWTQQYGFLGMMNKLSPLGYPAGARRGVGLAFDERGGAP